YGVLLEFWSFCAVGVGHGTSLPLFISFAPISVIGFVGSIESIDSTPPAWLTPILLLAPAVMWALAGFLLARAARSLRSRLAFLSFMAAHYLGVGFVVFQFREGLGGGTEPVWIIGWLLTYLLGQIVIWNRYLFSAENARESL